MKPYRLIALALAALLALTCVGWAEGNACPPVETGIGDISKHGNLPMRISGRALMALGYEYGDVVNVDVDGHVLQVPVCAELSEVDIGAAVLRIVPPDREFPDGRVSLGINGDNLASKVGLGERPDSLRDGQGPHRLCLRPAGMSDGRNRRGGGGGLHGDLLQFLWCQARHGKL